MKLFSGNQLFDDRRVKLMFQAMYSLSKTFCSIISQYRAFCLGNYFSVIILVIYIMNSDAAFIVPVS